MASDEVLVHVAGSRVGSRGDVDGAGPDARFHQPLDIAFNPDETFLYVADYGNFAVRRVDPDTGETETFAVLDASPNCLIVDENGLIWVNTIGPHNDAYEYEVETVLDPAAEFALDVKVPNKGGANYDALWVFEPDGTLVFRVEVGSLADPEAPFSESGTAGSFIGNTNGYTPGVSVSGVFGTQRNTQSGRPFGTSAKNNFIMRIGQFSVASAFGAGDGGAFDVTKGYWYEDSPGVFFPYPEYTVIEDGTPEPEICPGGDECGDSPCLGDPDQQCCCVANQARDGAFASNVGIVGLRDWNAIGRYDAYVFGLEYQYPSNRGMAAIDYVSAGAWPGIGADCIDELDPCSAFTLPAGVTGHYGDTGSVTAAVRHSDAFGSTNVDNEPMGFSEWGPDPTTAGWQLAVGEVNDPMDTYFQEVGTAMYASSLGWLQTFVYTNAATLGSPIHRGLTRAPVRGVAYSATREEWFFTTSATSGAYGPYTKNEDGDYFDYGFHQVMRMVPFVEVNPTATYHLGDISGEISSESDDTTTGIFVGMHIEVNVLPVAPASGVVEPELAIALDSGAVVPGPAYNEPPQLPAQFVREPNPLPPETDPREVPLPPWIPDGPHREES